MPFEPHPDNPDLVIYKPNEHWIPKPWQGLTDDEIHKIIDDCTSDEAEQEELNDFAKAVRAAELRLKEKNGG